MSVNCDREPSVPTKCDENCSSIIVGGPLQFSAIFRSFHYN